MSVFRKFKLPQLLRKGPPASEIGEDIPRFKCSELPLKQRLGQGSFGDVYTAEYRASGDTKCHTVVVKKMLAKAVIVYSIFDTLVVFSRSVFSKSGFSRSVFSRHPF